MNHRPVVRDAVTVEHAWRFEIGVPAVDDDTVVVEVVDDAAVWAGGPAVIADAEPVACPVAVGAGEVVASVGVVVGSEVGRADNESSQSEIEASCRHSVEVIGIGADGR